MSGWGWETRNHGHALHAVTHFAWPGLLVSTALLLLYNNCVYGKQLWWCGAQHPASMSAPACACDVSTCMHTHVTTCAWLVVGSLFIPAAVRRWHTAVPLDATRSIQNIQCHSCDPFAAVHLIKSLLCKCCYSSCAANRAHIALNASSFCSPFAAAVRLVASQLGTRHVS